MSAMTGLPFPGSRRLRGQIDLMHATDHLIPKLGGIPTVATLFDAIPLSHPEWVSIQHRVFKNALWRRAARWAAHIVTISEYSKREIEKHFGIPATRITAIPLGVDERWFRPIAPGKMAEVLGRHGIAAPFFLCVGTLQPRKNVGRVIEAYRSFPQSIRDAVPLVIVGRAGWRCEDIVDGLTAGAYGPSVRWLRHLPDDDLLAVMRAATVLVCPSLYEGFGLPVLEAFASGTPVVTSTASSLPEVAGDAALLVDPQDTGAIATAMLRLLEDTELADSLRQKGYARAREYSWDRTASRTLDVYRQVLGRA